MEIKARIEKGKETWIVETKNVWTGKITEKKFATSKAAQEYVHASEAVKDAERKILQGKKTSVGSANVTVHGLLKIYFDNVLENATTIKQSGYHAAQIVEAFGKRRAKSITSVDITNFMRMQKNRGCAQITINRRISILRTAINWAVAQGMFEATQIGEIRLPKSAPKKIIPPTPDELRLMLKVASGHISRVIMLGLYTGARVGPSELFRLKWEHVDFWSRVIHLPCAEKNDKIDTRDIPIRETLLPLLREWKEEDEHFGIEYLVHYAGKPVRTIARAWGDTLSRAGINRKIRPYDLRHAYATYSIAGGADIKTVAEIMGHSDASMILKTYQHVQPEQKRKAVEVIPDIF